MAGNTSPFAEQDSMKRGLLADEERREGLGLVKLDEFVQEVNRIGYLAGPMVAVNFSQYFLQVISVIMVGHLGELSLSSSAIVISFCAVTGFCLLVSVLFSLFILAIIPIEDSFTGICFLISI
ncbi:hypothetical protein SLEP1_g4254 [Rubroshorea leprosula]|uniref:Uncharacterized protein n=1 Tax=Rubroshorea leprosula TaxID=152421 RepID=A0AAV5HVS2_9ROSI|nr:hypothetical protein SLEP1_g4254 [Rubroshorea leprosula]